MNIVLLPKVPEALAASFCISYWRNLLHHLPEEHASICITYRRNVTPSVSPTGGICPHLHHLPEEHASIGITYRRDSICITYRRNLPPSASPTGGTCLHLHHLPEELASIRITYRRTFKCIHLYHIWEKPTPFICITCRRNLLPQFASPAGGTYMRSSAPTTTLQEHA